MEPKTIVITGGSDGIGAEAARQLLSMGHHVVIVGRNPEKTARLAKTLSVPYHTADYGKLSDVCRLARELSAYPRIDVLANNAGAVMNRRTLTEDGFEKTFQINVLGEFLLTNLLLDKLIACHATVIQTASIAVNLFGQRLQLENLQNETQYTAVKAYGESKLCNVLFTRELHRRYCDQGICAVAFEPGVPRTNFACEGSAFFRTAYHSPLKYLFTISPRTAARRMVRLATGTPGTDFTPGLTYSGTKPYPVRFADDGSIARALWETCTAMVQDHDSGDSIQ